MNQEQAERLLTLAWFLRTQVEAERFSMRTMCTCVLKSGARRDISPQCGTTACALGWATHIWPETFSLRARGLVSPGESTALDLCAVEDGVAIGTTNRRVLNFFGLDVYEADWAFGGQHIRTPVQEAEVLEALARKRGWEYA
jgi:hypothetical protein